MTKILNALTDELLAKINGLPDAAQFRAMITFSKNANLSGGNFLVSGEVTGSVTKGWILPWDADLITVTVCRTDSDAADIEILCDGVVTATIPTSATNTVIDGLSLACNQGQVVSARNKAGGSTISNATVVVGFQGTI